MDHVVLSSYICYGVLGRDAVEGRISVEYDA